jgi:hypothetical protein
MHGKICALAKKTPPTAISKTAITIRWDRFFILIAHQLPDHPRVRVEEVTYPALDEGYRDTDERLDAIECYFHLLFTSSTQHRYQLHQSA